MKKLFLLLLTSLSIFAMKAEERTAIIIKTSIGDITVELYNETPQHRDNFIKLVNEKFYDSILFHRVIKDFMVQAGDPDSKTAQPDQALGSGSNGYTIPAEFNTNLLHTKGALAAARTGDNINPQRRSSGCQFYIVEGKKMDIQQLEMMEQRLGIKYSDAQKKAYIEQGGTPFLDMQYTVFGQVIKGIEVVDAIQNVKTGRNDRPMEDVRILGMEIVK
jgi:peptidyl-prolyl cis-trans isomerase B (cyclophilin B)